MTMQFAIAAALTTGVAAGMMRLGAWKRRLVLRSVRHCPRCGTRLSTRVCPHCTS